MIPIIELRGAIPVGAGLSSIDWVADIFNLEDGLKLSWWMNYLVAVIGNMLPVPFILFFIRSILNMMKKGPAFFSKIANGLENRVQKHVAKFEKSQYIALLLFVGIPIPGTGAWTGSLIAALLGMRIKYSLPTIFAGVILAGGIMTLASYGLLGFLKIFI